MPKARKGRRHGSDDADEEEAMVVDAGEEGDGVIEFPGGDLESEDETDAGAASLKGGGKNKSGGFQSMGFSPAVYKSVMRKGYRVPTPIQRRAIPPILAGQDVVAMARTGSGKTAAFLLPMFEKLKAHSSTVGVRAAILSPTRELAIQTHKFCKELSHFVTPPLRFCLLVGGDAMEDQFDTLSANPDVIVATPGRLQHILLDAQLSLARVEFVVFDEADRLFEMGFASQLHAILAGMPTSRQTLLFSATMPAMLADFTRASLHEPQLIRLDVETKLSEALRVEFFKVRSHEKFGALLIVLTRILSKEQQTIVFASTRHHVELLQELLTQAGHQCSAIYGTLDPAARKISLGKFRAGKSKVLIVTDVAARGIDVPLLDNVVNFDFPTKPKLFVHRAGRAARAGRTGTAVSLVEPDELPFLMDLTLYLGKPLRTTSAGPNTNPASAVAAGGSHGGEDAVELGKFPAFLLTSEVEFVNSLISERPELKELARVASRASQMYKKTRGSASRASLLRARELPADLGVHPMMAGTLDLKAEASRASLLTDLQSFRPGSMAIASAAHAQKKQVAMPIDPNPSESTAPPLVADAAPGAAAFAPTASRLSAEEPSPTTVGPDPLRAIAARMSRRAMKAVQKARTSAGSSASSEAGAAPVFGKRRSRSSVADAEYYMPSMQPAEPETEAEAFLRVGAGSGKSKLDAAVLDLIEDERDGISRQRSVIRWDARKKKYVREKLGQVGIGAADGIADRAKKRMRDESGSLVQQKKKAADRGKGGAESHSDGSMYASWKKASKRRIQAPGEQEASGAGAGDWGARGGNRYCGGRFKHMKTKPLPNAHVPDELRKPEQIARARRDAEKKRSRGRGGSKGGRKGSASGGGAASAGRGKVGGRGSSNGWRGGDLGSARAGPQNFKGQGHGAKGVGKRKQGVGKSKGQSGRRR